MYKRAFKSQNYSAFQGKGPSVSSAHKKKKGKAKRIPLRDKQKALKLLRSDYTTLRLHSVDENTVLRYTDLISQGSSRKGALNQSLQKHYSEVLRALIKSW